MRLARMRVHFALALLCYGFGAQFLALGERDGVQSAGYGLRGAFATVMSARTFNMNLVL